MKNKRLIGAALFVLLLGIPGVVHARIHFPFFGHSHHSHSAQTPSEMARTDTGTPYQSGWDTGYRRGYQGGQSDHNSGAKFDADDSAGYKSGHSFCESLEGRGEHQCRKAYKEGFKLGYQDGYSGLTSRLITTEEIPQSQARASDNWNSEQPETPTPSDNSSAATQDNNQDYSSDQTTQADNQNYNSQDQNQAYRDTTQAQNLPRSMPRTASSLPLIGFLGFIAITFSLLFRAFRKSGKNEV